MNNTCYFFLLFSSALSFPSCRSVKPVVPKPTEVATYQPSFTAEDPEKCTIIEVPNVFSPNGDQIHDRFKITSYCHLSNFEFTIYNRWGNLIVKMTDQFFEWDGTGTDGKIVLDGTYFYACSYEYSGTKYDVNGNVTILR